MTYDEARAKIRADREHYGSQWKHHLDRYGPIAYFYELAGIMGRLESLMTYPLPNPYEGGLAAVEEEILDKLLDLGNYAAFMYDWMQERKAKIEHEVFKETFP